MLSWISPQPLTSPYDTACPGPEYDHKRLCPGQLGVAVAPAVHLLLKQSFSLEAYWHIWPEGVWHDRNSCVGFPRHDNIISSRPPQWNTANDGFPLSLVHWVLKCSQSGTPLTVEKKSPQYRMLFYDVFSLSYVALELFVPELFIDL